MWKQAEKHLMAGEMWFLKMQKILKMVSEKNKVVLQEAIELCKLFHEIYVWIVKIFWKCYEEK